MPDDKAKIEIELALQNTLPPSMRAFSRALEELIVQVMVLVLLEIGTGNFKKVRDQIQPLKEKAEKTSTFDEDGRQCAFGYDWWSYGDVGGRCFHVQRSCGTCCLICVIHLWGSIIRARNFNVSVEQWDRIS